MVGKKASGELEVLCTILLIIVVILSALQITMMLPELVDLLTLGSNEAVADNIAGLITISGAAPDSIHISYGAASESGYTVVVQNRIVTVSSSAAGSQTKTAKVGLGNILEEFDGVFTFAIEKNVIKSSSGVLESTYQFIATG